MELPDLDAVIHQPTRLKVIALLYRNRDAAFTWVRDQLGLTDGNLSSHASRLEEAGYVTQGRVLTPRGFQVRLRITPEGDAAFATYVRRLHTYLDQEVRLVERGDAEAVR